MVEAGGKEVNEFEDQEYGDVDSFVSFCDGDDWDE